MEGEIKRDSSCSYHGVFAIVIAKSIVIIPQGEAAVVERLGRYTKRGCQVFCV